MNVSDNVLNALRESAVNPRRMAIVYLRYKENLSANEILALGCKLAVSTIKTYIYKFKNLFKAAIKYFSPAPNYTLTTKTEPENFWCYIDKIVMPNGETWTKVGKTTQTPKKRAYGFSWGPKGNKVRPLSTEVLVQFKCKDKDSMKTLEDLLRSAMIAINPFKYEMLDRLLEFRDEYPSLIVNNPEVQAQLPNLVIA